MVEVPDKVLDCKYLTNIHAHIARAWKTKSSPSGRLALGIKNTKNFQREKKFDFSVNILELRCQTLWSDRTDIGAHFHESFLIKNGYSLQD